MNIEDILASITDSHLLAEYATNDDCLRAMLTALSESPATWKTYQGILVGSGSVPARQMERTFKIRLSHMPRSTTSETLKLSTATQQLIAYCTHNPTAGIVGVIFNCSTYSYGVFCGIVGEKIEAICVMKGPSVPDYATI